ncbi:glycosyl hydrolase family 18 protein [Neobacillus niacini]|uniref:glycosyl hydrolase family 18 protein n=1 Tax=Neobacillus niacini TaxID=86668 RepID=UPI0021CB0898|nr:LysM peptidoglycan-binding domain-containing protein [Neobacillus niacini]MCM3768511.1 glycosyl hydrolase family 18 protein [Neobacillus niacini]
MAIHVVIAGESLWEISNQTGVPIGTIINNNGLASNTLVPGLALYLPDTTQQIRLYRVKAGDQLRRIAQQFQTTTSNLLTANPGIDPERLNVGQIIHIPTSLKLQINTLGFIVPSPGGALPAILESIAGQLTFLAIVAYSFTDEGYAYNQIDDTALVARSKQLNIAPLLMIRNFTKEGFSPELAGSVLGNRVYRQNLIASIANLTRQRGFAGVSIDFEFVPTPNRTDFNVFLTDLKRELGNLILHVNVHAKSEDMPTNRIVGAYDYAAIGRAADIVAVMTIDYGYPGGPPDPVAPITWMEKVIQYAVTQIPAQKLQIAMALYGYDKVVGTNASQAMSVLAAQNHAISTGTPIQFDMTSQSPWYSYLEGVAQHVVWFEDIRSYLEKYHLIDIYGLSGITFWQIILPAPQNWLYLRDNILVLKR